MGSNMLCNVKSTSDKSAIVYQPNIPVDSRL